MLLLMNLFRSRKVCLPIVAIGAVAWLAISNHCALAALGSATPVVMPSCHATAPAHHAPAPDREGGVECCKVLRATVPSLAKSLVSYNSFAFTACDYPLGLIASADESPLTSVLAWDTGPPGYSSFAELVLQRSLLAHAPPNALS